MGVSLQMIKALCWALQSTGEKLTLNLGKARVVPQIKGNSSFISNFCEQEELPGEAAPTSSDEGPQGSPWSYFPLPLLEFGSSALRRDEGSGVLVA